jgi:hypothetical protein
MALGYSSAGSCFATAAEAVDAYYSNQQATPTGTKTFLFTNVSGVWKGTTLSTTGTTDSTYTAPSNVYGSCTLSATSGNASTDYSYTDAAAMWGFAFSTVFMLWYLAKNLGLIMNAVRRW